jgi:murein L,D-transpeptidase YcbB/YkuD
MRVGFKLLAAAAAIVSARAVGQPDMPIEPVEIPPSIQQGVDLIYIDPDMAKAISHRDAEVKSFGLENWTGAPIDLFMPVNQTYTDLRRGLMKYKARWGSLPDVQLPEGPSLKPGSTDPRVSLLRKRLGLPDGTQFDAALAQTVKDYQAAHGLTSDGIVGNGTIQSLNLGPEHYEREIILNMERARRLPAPDEKDRYILVDAGAAKLYMYEGGKPVDSMNVIVGDSDRQTPMMAAELRYVQLNPYWNVPPDLSRTIVAKAVLAQGLQYLTDRDYEVYSTSADGGQRLDPASVDWQAVYDGKTDVELRRGPGEWNSMGKIKFMIPNAFGIYLHDVPPAEKPMFDTDARWISNGCIRLQDAARLEKWAFGGMPKPSGEADERVDVPNPVPVYITYFTVAPSADGVVFRPDRYHRDAPLLARVKLKTDNVDLASGD